MPYSLRSGRGMDSADDQGDDSAVPTWASQIQEMLQQQQQVLQQQLQQQHDQHRRDLESLRHELHDEIQRKRPQASPAEAAGADSMPQNPAEGLKLGLDSHVPASLANTDSHRGSASAAPGFALPYAATSTAAPEPVAAVKRPSFSPPEKLTSSTTLNEFRTWRSSWDDYYRLSSLSTISREDQLAYLRACFTEDMRAASLHAIGICSHSDTAESALNKIERYLRLQRNVAVDRVRFEERCQHEDEPFDSFLIALKELAADAELCTTCIEERITTRIMSGIQDQETRRKLLAIRPFPSLVSAVDMCRSAEAARANDGVLQTTLSGTQCIQRVYRHQERDARSTSRVRPSAACNGCGRTGHSRKSCPAANLTCFNCGLLGHLAKVCRNKRSSQQNQDRDSRPRQPSTASVPQVVINRMQSNLQAPKVGIRLRCCEGTYLASLEATPDSGAEITVMSAEIAHSIGVSDDELSDPPGFEVSAANGQAMRCIGTFRAVVTLGERSVEDTIHVFRESRGLLLAWYTAKNLGILPEHYPAPLPSKPSSSDQSFSSPKSCVVSPICTQPDGSEHQLRQSLLRDYCDVFTSETEEALPPMTGPPMSIHVLDDATPFAVRTARPVPHAWRDEVKKKLDDMVRQEIIAPLGDQPSDWCHPLVIVPKPSGGVRVCVDLTKLNRFVKRPLHPLVTPRDAVTQVPSSARFFSTLDAKSGYWQLPLDVDSMSLTTFITAWGRFKFLRAPMGLVSTGDEYCRRVDLALQGLGNFVKVVDDILVFSDTLEEHERHLRAVLDRCRDHGITINREKFSCATGSVSYCGYTISSTGKQADPRKVAAIAEFAPPTNITEMRSFMGLVQQLGDFSSDVSTAAEPLRALLKPSNAFIWTPDHQAAFQSVKTALSSPPILAHYDPKLPTVLQTDAARLKGLGYALLQQHGSHWRLVQCGSRFLSDTESRYAMIELELLALVWALKKCRIFLQGLQHFTVVVDHRPLLPILNDYTMDAVENPRLQRLKEKTTLFNFTTVWKKGKEHVIPDALSRAPVDGPASDDECLVQALEQQVQEVSSVIIGEVSGRCYPHHLPDPRLGELRREADADDTYQRLLEMVTGGFPNSKNQLPQLLLPFWSVRHELTVHDGLILKGCRIMVPVASRKATLEMLHASHQGIDRTKRRARQTVWWPGINSDITNTVSACNSCQERRASLPQEPMATDPPPSRIFEDVSSDIFTLAGRNFLVYVDRLSNWPVVFQLPRGDATSRQVIRAFREAFVSLGVPVRVRTDGGPQYKSRQVSAFLKRWGVAHVFSTPHYPQSNGHAEAAVKTVKNLIAKTTNNGCIDDERLDRGLLELRNTPGPDGRSPAQIVFGHPIRSWVPAHRNAFAPEWQQLGEDCDAKAAQKKMKTSQRYDASAKSLLPLKIGDLVRIQDPFSKRWNQVGSLVGVGRHRDYLVKLPSGRVLWRNRRYLRTSSSETEWDTAPSSLAAESSAAAQKKVRFSDSSTSHPRRGMRQRHPPDRLTYCP